MAGSTYGQELAKGTVYVDANNNGQFDRKEIGLAAVSVSNGKDVVQTDSKGKYEIPVYEDNIIFVIKPSGYQLQLDSDNQNKSYYIYKPKGAPNLEFSGVAPTGKLPKSIDFGLTVRDEAKQFSAFLFGDPQAYNEDEMDYFKKGVVEEAKTRKGPLFGISLGDLVGNDLSLHPSYKSTIGQMNLPWFNVIGNHDLNFDVEQDSLSDEGFEKVFGPANYAFNVGDAHFIVLDNIIYPHPETGKGYQGGFRKDQLEFVANNLKFVPKDKLIVLAFHIPLNPNNGKSFRNDDRQVLFDILKDYPNILALSAHTHYQQQIFYSNEHGWKGAKPLHEYNVGTTSGDWYSGIFNEAGVPNSTMRDGTPKGYAILNVNGNQYNFDYKVAGKSDDHAIGVFAPSIVSAKHSGRYYVYANFFLGSKNDKIRYRINEGDWKIMQRIEAPDPAYTQQLLAYDGATTLIPGRRPSDPVVTDHLWRLKLPKLKVGKHQVIIEATDMFGRTHSAKQEIEVVD